MGFQDCVGTICSARHRARPGLRVDGFIGGNIHGYMEIGLSGGWGTLQTRVPRGANALLIYGVNVEGLERLADVTAGFVDLDLDSLDITHTELRTVRGGPVVRVHLVPRGRFLAYVGSGVGYTRFAARYTTASSGLWLTFHGFDVPAEAAFGVHLHEHVALLLHFQYLWARYLLVNVQHPESEFIAPLRLFNRAMRDPRRHDLKDDLPDLWGLAIALRARY